MSATTGLDTYQSPIKFDVEIVAGALMAGVILGLINRFVTTNKLVKLAIGAVLYFYGPFSAYGSFIKLAGLTMIADEIYSIMKETIKIGPASSASTS